MSEKMNPKCSDCKYHNPAYILWRTEQYDRCKHPMIKNPNSIDAYFQLPNEFAYQPKYCDIQRSYDYGACGSYGRLFTQITRFQKIKKHIKSILFGNPILLLYTFSMIVYMILLIVL